MAPILVAKERASGRREISEVSRSSWLGELLCFCQGSATVITSRRGSDHFMLGLSDRLRMVVAARRVVIQARDVDPREPWPDGRDRTQDEALPV